MAETFGVVASTFGIMGVVIQISETVYKLKTFWRQVKDAPEDIRVMLEELESFNEVISEIQRQTAVHQVPTVTQRTSELCAQRCAQASRKLISALKVLEMHIKKSPKRGGFRFKLKEDKLAKLRSMLEDAKDSMWLARDIYCSELDRHEHYVLKSRLDLLYDEVLQIKARTSIGMEMSSRSEIQSSSPDSETPKEASRTSLETNSEQKDEVTSSQEVKHVKIHKLHGTLNFVDGDILEMKETWLSYLLGSIHYRRCILQSKHTRGTQKTSLSQEEAIMASWKLPSWLANISCETCLRKSRFGWKFQMQVDHVISPESLAWIYISTGDLTELQAMFERHELSPNARTPRNLYMDASHCSWFNEKESLLTYAVYSEKLDICRCLIDLGADGSGIRSDSITPLGMASFNSWRFPGFMRVPENLTELVAIVRLLLDEGGADPDLPVNHIIYGGASVLSLASMASSEVKSLLHSYAYPSYQDRSLKERFNDAMRLYSHNLEQIQFILGRKIIDHEVILLDFGNYHDPFRLYKHVIWNLGYNRKRMAPLEPSIEIAKTYLNNFLIPAVSGFVAKRFPGLYEYIAASIYRQKCGHFPGNILALFLKRERYLLRPIWWPIYQFKDCSGTLDISPIVQAWIKDLKDAGMDSLTIRKYGQYEKSSFLPINANFEAPCFYLYGNEGNVTRVRIIALRTGPEVSDWRAWLSDPWGEEIAKAFGQFWDMVERPYVKMPGSWTEDVLNQGSVES